MLKISKSKFEILKHTHTHKITKSSDIFIKKFKKKIIIILYKLF